MRCYVEKSLTGQAFCFSNWSCFFELVPLLELVLLLRTGLIASRKVDSAEREHPEFGNTGLSAGDDHSANVIFKERPPWAQMFTFPRQTLGPLITSALSFVDKRPGWFSVGYRCKFGPYGWLHA